MAQLMALPDLSTYIEIATKDYLLKNPLPYRKEKGQFFTPASIANFMASSYRFTSPKQSYTILDPGAGAGILVGALCDILFIKSKVSLKAVLYENDPVLQPLLESNMKHIKKKSEERGNSFNYEIIGTDFIEDNYQVLKESQKKFDFIISNPPYFKLNKQSSVCRLMQEVVKGQPNIYYFFMAISANLLVDSGQLAFITPRSFCSGDYFEKFRQWFLSKVHINKIHIFGSRKQVFESEVLQEFVILTASKKRTNRIKISQTENGDFKSIRQFSMDRRKVISGAKEGSIIRVPESHDEASILDALARLKYRLPNLGVKISTGPVVDFRAKKYLSNSQDINGSLAPLLWMHNLKNFKVHWPYPGSKKPISIINNSESNKLLRLNSNYVLVKRFTSKEQKRRLYASVLVKAAIPSDYVGIENHLNYIWKPKGELKEETAFGLSALLNSTYYDRYFRIINGNTQVNANDINKIPFPSIEEVDCLGKKLKKSKQFNHEKIDLLVSEILENAEKR